MGNNEQKLKMIEKENQELKARLMMIEVLEPMDRIFDFINKIESELYCLDCGSPRISSRKKS